MFSMWFKVSGAIMMEGLLNAPGAEVASRNQGMGHNAAAARCQAGREPDLDERIIFEPGEKKIAC